jgi:regulatory protein
MAKVTKLNTPSCSPRRRSVHLDGRWAFNCSVNVAERFGLAVGRELSADEVATIATAETRQKAIDKALGYLSRRLHSREELRTRLARGGYDAALVQTALDELTRLGYIDDARFAEARATSAARHRKHGPRRAYVDLVRAGVGHETARRAAVEVFETHDSMKVARELAMKKLPALRRLAPEVARRRLMGMLLRRGFTYDQVRPVIEETVGRFDDERSGD